MIGSDSDGRPQPCARHVVGFRTDVGHLHNVNQDAGGAWTWTRPDGSAASLLVVADGVSAGRRSEDASRLVVERIVDRLGPVIQHESTHAECALDILIDAAREANHEVARRPHESAQNADATTVAALVCLGEEAVGLWCGDSRVYHIGSGVDRITRDHSWAEDVVSRSLMTPEEAALDRRAHMITRWLGPPDRDDPGLETFRFGLSVGDSVLCCSDGLYLYFTAPFGQSGDIEEMFDNPSVQGVADTLVTSALRRGGHDNITAAVLKVLPAEP